MKFDQTMVNYVADGIVCHVQNGGWIGASWSRYIVGATALTTEELDASLELAEQKYWEQEGTSLAAESQRNFLAENDLHDEE